MNIENKVFLGVAVIVCLGTAGYITYSDSEAGNPNPSNMAFSSQSKKDAHQPPKDTVPEKKPDLTPSAEDRGAEEEAEAERTKEVGRTLRNLNVKTESIQKRLIAQYQTIETLKQQVTALAQARHQDQEKMESLEHSYEKLQEKFQQRAQPQEISARQTSKVNTERKMQKGYRVTKIFDDQAWIKTPQGRTYIVEEGEWFGSEYVISINSAEHTVVTTAGDLAL